MKKIFITLFFASILSVTQCAETKLQKIEQLFDMTNDKQAFLKAFNKAIEPFFASFKITDEDLKKSALDKYFGIIKKDYITVYDKFFNETDIDDMIKYYQSPTGKKFAAVMYDLNTELQKGYASIMQIVQELAPKPEVDSNLPKSTDVIHIDDLCKNKKDAEVRSLFSQQLKHDGLTVVKFSASWCGPCKTYAPEFEKVAKELKEVTVNGKKIAIKYIATDIDATKTIASDNNVVSIPTTIIYKNGQKIDSQTGYMNSSTLATKIKQLAK